MTILAKIISQTITRPYIQIGHSLHFLDELGMTEEDTLLLMLVTLFSDDRPNALISERAKIRRSKSHFVSLILRHMGDTDNRGTECLLLLPLLRTLNNSFMEVLANISVSGYKDRS